MDERKIYRLIIFIVLVGAIVPFAAQFILPVFKPGIEIAGVEIWNQYVSIILGVIATITSVVSLVLGFRSEKESKNTEIRTRDLLKEIQGNIKLVSQKQDVIRERFCSRSYEITNKIKINKDAQINTQDEYIS